MLAAEELLHVGGFVEHRGGARQQRAAVLVQHQPSADAVEQRCAEGRFEVGERGAGGRLRARDALGGGAGRAAARGGDEDFELAQVQAQARDGGGGGGHRFGLHFGD